MQIDKKNTEHVEDYEVGFRKPPKNRQFGKPGGNPICPQHVATQQREFYKWALTQATQKELSDYLQDDRNPFFRKKLIKTIMESASVGDFCNLTNQIYGNPKQTIEMQELPSIDMSIFGVKPKDDTEKE